ncbi:MAG: class I SAM-dependent methyltransferase [Caldilineaceae bacterium]|nr:class I SAM-dependent methyltransferase [Caldilineaceae bacterium]
MQLIDIINRDPNPAPWAEGDNIPWHEPEFSRRMLTEHLTQAHNAASRRFEIIDAHVLWMHTELLHETASSVLDLGCGPGLYSHRLARLGHGCVGIDFSPASIAYARQTAQQEGLDCTFVLADLRQAEFGTNFDLVTLIYGELNIFRPAHARQLLRKMQHALRPGGLLLLEPHTYTAVRNFGRAPAHWSTSASGLFGEEPHLVLTESVWQPDTQTTTRRHYVVEAESGRVTRYAQTFQAYTVADYRALLTDCGLRVVDILPALGGMPSGLQPDLFAIVATVDKS